MIAYLITKDESTEGIVLTDDTHADADRALIARDYYCEQLVAQGIKAKPVEYGVSALFEGVSVFKMEATHAPA